MTLLQYIVPRWAAAGPEAVRLGAVEALMRPLLAAATSASTSTTAPSGANDDGDDDTGGTDLRQAALSALLELARASGLATWEEVRRRGGGGEAAATGPIMGLSESLLVLRARHARLLPEDREAEREEDELAEALQLALATAPPPLAAIGTVVDDHVPVDLSDPNLRDALGGSDTGSRAASLGETGLTAGTGAMMACPKVDRF